MELLDWIVIALYAGVVLAVGKYFSRKTKTSDDYLLGGRKMKPWTVGLSLFASLFSAISYLSIPGEVIKFGPMLLCGLIGYPLVFLFVGWFLIPTIMKANVSSAYELLEIRIGVKVRILASLFFLILRVTWMSVIIYMCAVKVVVPIMGWPENVALWVSIAMVAITTIYTSMGGLRAVIITDVIQTFILIGAALFSLILIDRVLGGPSVWFPTEWPDGWLEWKLFDTKVRVSAGTALISLFSFQVCTAGSDQMSIQRYLATQNIKAARRGYLIQLITSCSVWIFLGLLGVAMMAYFRANPGLLPAGATSVRDCADELFPHFIVTVLPVGISGIAIAGLLAAAMSSLSSGVNSSCLVITRDLIGRFRKNALSESEEIKLAKIISVVIGVIVVMLSLIIGNIKGNLAELSWKTANLLTAPLFVPFFIALFLPRVRELPTIIGMLAGVVAAVFISFSAGIFQLFEIYCPRCFEKTADFLSPEFLEEGISFLWIIPCAFIAGVSAAALLNLLLPDKQRKTTPDSPDTSL